MGSPKVAVVIIVLALSIMDVLLVQGFECEKLPMDFCAFSVSSTGNRCVLDYKYSSTSAQHECQSSGIMVEKFSEWIESEECLDSCGLQRIFVGLSSDDLNSYSPFSSQLCSEKCQNNCPNIVDLYSNLAAGEGIYLPSLCEINKKISEGYEADAPAPSPYGYTS
ncbi:hypothetical protein SUGI_0775410 [Cryptomeria japonica]|uniref:uncharacterized protein LOC131856989 n=1 Tax=Cryptomeria japonica TaxID=3369 RepID=UPI002414C1C0|nr:uncharacterized protein LOC131856989 [Cryptomeria japonica]GLJ38090.1 hypothetical protein SUGI_0775410 [Cryptomeria japonica]